MTFGPSDRWYDPPEPPAPCCRRAEDGEWECPGCGELLDPDCVCHHCGLHAVEHDQQACLDAQAEDAAEARAEALREQEQEYEYMREYEAHYFGPPYRSN